MHPLARQVATEAARLALEALGVGADGALLALPLVGLDAQIDVPRAPERLVEDVLVLVLVGLLDLRELVRRVPEQLDRLLVERGALSPQRTPRSARLLVLTRTK